MNRRALTAELLNMIASEVTSSQDLLNLRAANTALHGIVTPRAFRHVRVTNSKQSADAFAGILRSKSLVRNIQQVVLQDKDADDDGTKRGTQDDGHSAGSVDGATSSADSEPVTVDRYEGAVDETINALRAAFAMLSNLPNLRTLRLIFCPTLPNDWDSDFIPELEEQPDEFRLQLAVLEAVAEHSDRLSLRSLSIINVFAFHNELFERPSFAALFKSVTALRVDGVSDTISVCACFSVPFCQFWGDTLPQCFLQPVNASGLESLTLTSDQDMAAPPDSALTEVHFPALKSLSLTNFLFCDLSFRIEEFLLRHKDSLEYLELRGSKIVLPDWADEPTELWAQKWSRFSTEFASLKDLVVEDTEFDESRPLRYAKLDPEYGWMPEFMEMPGEEQDNGALEAWRAVVAARRAK
ncbi:hypothetical protein EWM64_g2460 [Hericium alpestre]|uniref:F-box domain-containing protein n=1 Tax=Hericium alpestre TaxID=135208 RepID=A0A4Z0A3G0_9AGAM|nr:hypothetical protein EWM64_g2460 [Hericium alpestre]